MLNLTNNSHMSALGKSTRKSIKWVLIDSAIIGAIAAFASLGGGPPTIEMGWIAFKAFGLAFFMQLAIERGLKKPLDEE